MSESFLRSEISQSKKLSDLRGSMKLSYSSKAYPRPGYQHFVKQKRDAKTFLTPSHKTYSISTSTSQEKTESTVLLLSGVELRPRLQEYDLLTQLPLELYPLIQPSLR